MKTGEKQLENWISELVGTLTDPIIVYPSPWMDTLPEEIRKQVPLERLVLHMRYQKGDIKEMTATEAEALLYMYPASLEFPLAESWANIYIYLGAQVCGRIAREVPEDLKNTVLTSYQMDKLDELKRWIYERRVKWRQEREKQGRKAEKEEKKKAAPKVIQHAFNLD